MNMQEDSTYALCLSAIQGAKQREHERIHCPLLSKTVDKGFCDNRKRNNTVECQMCEDMMAIRRKFVQNLIKYRRQALESKV